LVGLWMGDLLIARRLPTQMSRAGFEPTHPVCKWSKTARLLGSVSSDDRRPSVISALVSLLKLHSV